MLIDDTGVACIELKNLKQKGALEDYVMKFQLLAARSRIKEDISLIEYFIDWLNSNLIRAIYTKEKTPETINDMIEAASKAQTATNHANTIISKDWSIHTEKAECAVKTEKFTIDIG